ncbi:SGNH/GDSL hydrolase family protein [Gordonia sp. WA4-43]|uniref:SGNH/GDSL hydrolase family protein n=1 Tax=Gordonia sp. WA4-43 TaxID=2878678 RepID=UPI001CFB32ED|nr:SGNH/GDSL hydrolase family protein [Gordonia sp. WA4-43]UCZ91849.1 SGNH/GDSL hydrolase family protein [Gordonia sp. WA4-43]
MTVVKKHWQKLLLLSALSLLIVLTATAVVTAQERDTPHRDTATGGTTDAVKVNEDADAVTPTTILVIGDSVTEGTDYGGRGAANWTALVQSDLSEESSNSCPILLRVSGRGGSGYATTGTRKTTFGSETERLLTPDVSAVVYVGSGNDLSQLSSDYVNSVVQTVDLVHDHNPDASVLIVGPSWIHNGPVPAEYLRANELLANAARRADALFVDPIASGWFDDAPKTGIVGADGRHPTDAGHAIIASRMRPILKDLGRSGRCP